MIPLSIPHLGGNELKYVTDCIDRGWVSSAGSYVTQFENMVANFSGCEYGVATCNGTSGLHLAMHMLGIEQGDIVLVPNITFIASANAVAYTNATPVFMDVDPETWQMDLDLLEEWLVANNGIHVKAVMPVHVLGNMCDMPKLMDIAVRHGLYVIEDSTEALGSFKNGKHAGTFGLTGVLSFNGNKIISTGGGGMILTNDKEIANRAKHITTTAKTDPLDYFHDEVGYNYRLVNVLAAIGVAQMENFESILKRKKEIDALYRKELDGIGDIQFQENDPNSDPNCWLFTFRTKKMRALLNHLNINKIQSRPFWTPMNNLPMYKNLMYVNENDISNKIFKECISIPSSSNLTIDDQYKVISEIKNFYK